MNSSWSKPTTCEKSSSTLPHPTSIASPCQQRGGGNIDTSAREYFPRESRTWHGREQRLLFVCACALPAPQHELHGGGGGRGGGGGQSDETTTVWKEISPE
ncbi:hypothetical protein C0Q70_16007 [Pomacea canaliculata]|uniref:Uncharacterized protein n=1 Tax=Pomacea canaliculata TaxID=400727 RepID=A0A2T7NNJ9_POMCA|nr:hypothetical protein C0Q70_16007 [Pomacea canaliculata]